MESDSNLAKNESILFTRKPDKENEKRLKNYYHTLLATDPDSFLKDLSRFIKVCDTKKSSVLLDIIERENSGHMLLAYRVDEDDTILHIAAKYDEGDVIIKKIIHICPHLIVEEREKSPNYCGQTALHIAVAKGNLRAAETILLKARSYSADVLRKVLHTKAVGRRFINTVMMGEVPLNIAALKCHREMIDILIDNQAEIDYQNSTGDTVFHSLVKYSAIHPHKIPAITQAIEFIQNRIQTKERNEKESKEPESGNIFQPSNIWLKKNEDGYSALQLAAKLGVVDVFLHIINMKDVYCFTSSHDGLFDVNVYDITDVDSVYHYSSNKLQKTKTNDVIQTSTGPAIKEQRTQSTNIYFTEHQTTDSVLEMIYSNNYQRSSALRMIEASPVKDIVREKWRFFRWIFYIWMVIHLWFVSSLTVYSVERMPLFFVKNLSDDIVAEYQEKQDFATGFQWMSFVVGVLYFIIAIKAIVAIFLRHDACSYSLKNIGYVFILFAFSVSILVDTFWTFQDKSHDSVPLILAIVMGWTFNLFFLRCFQSFGVFVELITHAAIGDLVRFATVFAMELIAFTTGMHIMFQTDDNSLSSNTQTYGSTIMMMFKLMLGFEDIGHLGTTRAPWLSIILFISFTALTYFLVFNTLIAMLSHTWSLLMKDKYSQWRIQQLSVILFLEEVFILNCIKPLLPVLGKTQNVSVFDSKSKISKSYVRRFLEIHSTETKYANEEDNDALKTHLYWSRAMRYTRVPSVSLSAYGRENRTPGSCQDRSFQTAKTEYREMATPERLVTKERKSILKKRPNETLCPDKQNAQRKEAQLSGGDRPIRIINAVKKGSSTVDKHQDDNPESLHSKQIEVEIHTHSEDDVASSLRHNVSIIGPPAIDIQQVPPSD